MLLGCFSSTPTQTTRCGTKGFRRHGLGEVVHSNDLLFCLSLFFVRFFVECFGMTPRFFWFLLFSPRERCFWVLWSPGHGNCAHVCDSGAKGSERKAVPYPGYLRPKVLLSFLKQILESYYETMVKALM